MKLADIANEIHINWIKGLEIGTKIESLTDSLCGRKKGDILVINSIGKYNLQYRVISSENGERNGLFSTAPFCYSSGKILFRKAEK